MSISVLAVKATSRALVLMGRGVLDRPRRALALERASAVLRTPANEAVFERLSPDSIRAIDDFFKSPEFEHLQLSVVLAQNSSDPASAHDAVRAEIVPLLKHRGVIDSFDRMEVSDAIYQVMRSAVVGDIYGSRSVNKLSPTVLQDAVLIASAAARNTRLVKAIADLRSIDDFASKMRTQIRSNTSKLRLPTVTGSRTIARQKLYIEPQLTGSPGGENYISFPQLLSGGLRTAILGDPGAGKSSLVGQIAHTLAGNSSPGTVPLVVVLRDHVSEIRAGGKPLLHYLRKSCEDPLNLEPPEDALEFLLLNGRGVVILDGLDELGDVDKRIRFVDLVQNFAQLYPTARILVTSRSVGYGDAPFDDEYFDKKFVMPFSYPQIEAYVQKWFALETIETHKAHSLANAFIRESGRIQDLRTNPLMLSLLCALFTNERVLPQSRPSVYQRCAEVLFDQWDRSRGIDVPYAFSSHMRPAICEVAWKIFTAPDGRQSLPRHEVIRVLLETVMADRFGDVVEATAAANAFLDFCSGRAWVLTKTGTEGIDSLYGFAHRTFLEYFAAAQLVRMDPDPSAIWAILSPQIHDSAWANVAQLATQILEQDRVRGADSLIELALQDAHGNFGVLLYLVTCLEWHVATNDSLASIADLLAETICKDPLESHFSFSSAEIVTDESDQLFNLYEAITQPDNQLRMRNSLLDALVERERVSEVASALLGYMMIDEIASIDDKGAESPAREPSSLALRFASLGSSKIDLGLAQYDIAYIYKWFGFGFSAYISQAERFLGEVVFDMHKVDESSVFVALEGLFHPLSAQSDQLVVISEDMDTATITNEWKILEFEKLQSWPLNARGALALLCFPFVRMLVDSILVNEVHFSDSFKTVLMSAFNESVRSEAVRIINSWKLPSPAHELWINYALSN